MSSTRLKDLDGILLQLQKVYNGNIVRKLRNDVNEVFSRYPNLNPKQDQLFQHDGTMSLLLVLRGTIPTIYKNNVYRTPIDIWIPSNYPNSGPIFYLTPWNYAGFELVRQHPHVNSEGLVSVQGLHWNGVHSNLSTHVQEVCFAFKDNPPLRAKQKSSSSKPMKSSSQSGIYQQRKQPPPPTYHSSTSNNSPAQNYNPTDSNTKVVYQNTDKQKTVAANQSSQAQTQEHYRQHLQQQLPQAGETEEEEKKTSNFKNFDPITANELATILP